ncbi:hypothetical protein GFY24_37025 [Nocardia sp. SYP-A9097]|uniref:hypothetical protein n=1 Tax=Nocardia sp. SYP-A9097 TaxID=2663237 RepID=UPI00129B5601|nr:hypothetical protein [Nocardia sp. SYP-A9097]MRH92959.1 hypothetical protein [Nocardia sp. SYP-A9097]
MPHNNSTDAFTRVDNEWGWLDDTPPTSLPTPTRTSQTDETEWRWLEDDSGDARPTGRTGGTTARRTPSPSVRRWIAPILTTAVATTVTIAAVLALRPTGEPPVAVSTTTAPSTTPAAMREGACAGLSAATITEGIGDTSSVAGVIAAFEYAYYRQRSADTAIRLLAPDAGIALEPLAAGIASVPVGTTHCVAITPIADTTVNVHLVELHPDHTRTDYLQVINLRRTESGLQINNIQKQG